MTTLVYFIRSPSFHGKKNFVYINKKKKRKTPCYSRVQQKICHVHIRFYANLFLEGFPTEPCMTQINPLTCFFLLTNLSCLFFSELVKIAGLPCFTGVTGVAMLDYFTTMTDCACAVETSSIFYFCTIMKCFVALWLISSNPQLYKFNNLFFESKILPICFLGWKIEEVPNFYHSFDWLCLFSYRWSQFWQLLHL